MREQLGRDLADALRVQDELAEAMRENSRQQQAAAGRIAQAQARSAQIEQDIDRLQAALAATNRRIQLQRRQLGQLARAIYIQPDSVLVLLGRSRSLAELVTAVADLEVAGDRARLLSGRLSHDRQELESEREALQAARVEHQRQTASLVADQARLVELQDRQRQTGERLAAQMDKTRQALRNLEKQSAELARQIADLLEREQEEIIAAAIAAVWDQVKAIYQAGVPVPNRGGAHSLAWPLPGAVLTQGFGPSPYAYEPPYENWPHFHAGLDLALPAGTPVLAADSGAVILAGSSYVNGRLVGYGNYVAVAHGDGLVTLYAHLDKIGVSVGDAIRQGQPIGLEGSTGNSTGAHLHFELRIGGKPVDPTSLLPSR